MTSVFLSYARDDDDEFVARIYAFLQSRSFEVWWDRESMPSRSLTFTEEIRHAIHYSDRLIVVIGPRALRSNYVRAEWQAALSEHKPVIPVLRRVPDGAGDPYSCLPAELRHFHAPSYLLTNGAEPPLDALAKILTDPVPPPAPVYGLPPEKPPHFRPRPDKFEEITAAVLGELKTTKVHVDQERITVLTGMGGIGKTVLAASVVQALRTRPSTLFEDGVYWLRESPLRQLARLSGATASDVFGDEVAEQIAQQLYGRRFLLVVDNATSSEQVAPLVRVLGAGGRMLVTTRHGELAVGRVRIDVDQLSEQESLQLVADWLRVSVDDLPAEARTVCELCGYHAFAISLNAAAVSQGLAWSSIVTALQDRDLDHAPHRFDEYVYETVSQSLAISVNALPEADRARYRQLAAFYWDPGVPAPAIARFWKERSGIEERRAQRLLVFLQQRSLIQLHGDPEKYEARLHDLHRAFISRDPAEVAAFGDELIKSYRPVPVNAWWNVPDDGYLQQHLVRHLMALRPADEALALLSAEDDEKRNRWYGTRAGAGGLAGYVADIQLAAAHITHPLLTLVLASLHSLAKATPGELLGMAVGAGDWSLGPAMARARLVAEPGKRAAAMIALLPAVKDRQGWLEETLDAVARAETTDRRALIESLANLATSSECLQYLRTIVIWVRNAPTGFGRVHTRPLVNSVIDQIPASLAPEAIAIVSAIDLRPLPLYLLLPEPERTVRICEVLRRADDADDQVAAAVRASFVSTVAPHLDRGIATTLVREALAAVQGLEPGQLRDRAMLDMLPCLSVDEQRGIVDELIGRAAADPHLFKTLATQSAPVYRARIREAVEGHPRLWVVAAAAPAFSGEHRQELVEKVLSGIEEKASAGRLLLDDDGALILAMNDEQLRRARRLIDVRLEGLERVRALIAVARATPADRREPTLKEALKAIKALASGEERERGYQEIASLLTAGQITEALAAAERIGEPSGIAHLPKMLPYLSGSVRERAIESFVCHAQTVPFGEWHEALLAIPEGLESHVLDALIEVARDLDVTHGKAHLLTALAPRVTKRRRGRVTRDALAAIAGCDRHRTRVELLLKLGRVNDAAREFQSAVSAMPAYDLVASVALLAPHVSQRRRAEWVGLALAAADEDHDALEKIADHLTPEQAQGYLATWIVERRPFDILQFRQLHELRKNIPWIHVDHKSSVGAALARRMAVLGKADAAFALLRIGRNDDFTATALVELAPRLSPEEVLFVEDWVRTAKLEQVAVSGRVGKTLLSTTARSYLLGRLAPSLARAGEVRRALQYAEETEIEWRAASYLGIAEAAKDDTRKHALFQALGAVFELRDVFRSEQIYGAARAIAGDAATAAAAWPIALKWASAHPRCDAIEVIAAFAPVAQAIGDSSLPDQIFIAIEQVLRWWP